MVKIITQGYDSQTRDIPGAGIRNPKPETRNLKPGTRNPEPGTRNSKIVALSILMAFATISCLTLDNEKVYTAQEEKMLREYYLNNLKNKGFDIDTTAVGVYYIVIEEGEGDFAKSKDTLTVSYAGWFIDEVLFDHSEIHYPDGKMEFILGSPPMLPGWDNGMTVMNKGAKIQFVIPSELAYGREGHGSIPPYQTLIFVVELFEIKPF